MVTGAKGCWLQGLQTFVAEMSEVARWRKLFHSCFARPDMGLPPASAWRRNGENRDTLLPTLVPLGVCNAARGEPR